MNIIVVGHLWTKLGKGNRRMFVPACVSLCCCIEMDAAS